ncbi:MAG: tripartite tricarboxylate transporter substrate binding protein, partial [Verrucomicrobiota bacterium]
EAGHIAHKNIFLSRPGGSGAVGHSAGARAKADGHTLQMATFELSTMHWMGISELTWENYEWLLQVNADPAALLVRTDSTWSDIGSFVNAVRESPGKFKMSGTATGGAWDLARAGMMLAAGLSVSDVVWVPTKGSAPSIVELLGGHIDAVCCSVPEAAAQIEAGQLKVLAVMNDERIPEYPDFPTLKESGVDWSAVGWRGFGLPKTTPPETVADLMGRLEVIAGSDAYRAFMKKNGFGITLRKGDDFKAFLQAQDAQWKTVIEKAGFAKS